MWLDCAIEDKYFTFGSFNSFNKINPDVVNVWSNILKRVSRSKLVLKTSQKNHSLKRLKELFKKNNVLGFEPIAYNRKSNKFFKHPFGQLSIGFVFSP